MLPRSYSKDPKPLTVRPFDFARGGPGSPWWFDKLTMSGEIRSREAGSEIPLILSLSKDAAKDFRNEF